MAAAGSDAACRNGNGRTGERLAGSALASDIPFLFARARAASTRNAHAALAQIGLKVRAFSVLLLACEGLRPTQRELSEFLSLDPSQIVALVDELERRGAVIRQADPQDRRQRIILPTPAGKRLLRKAQGLIQAANDKSLGSLTQAERQMLNVLLQQIVFPGGRDRHASESG